MNNFQVGQKVVCISNSPSPGFYPWDDDERPKVDGIYTVRRCFLDDEGNRILWLNEIARNEGSKRDWGPDVGYGAHRFRPITERETSIEVFKKLLVPTKTAEPV